ncbi:MAG TPA: hypothetical protein PK718_04480 [Candidatus Methanofastidiosa archaeon]|nr:hypothetical protein [Candidatus Methanofastidiosa archaeon]HPR41788.1 hypothetical protein [Candidatus Methanofastidiosa archaeon]
MGYDMDKAMSYVMQNGNIMETYMLEFLLELGRDDKVPLEFFEKYQNKDGGFCFDLVEGRPSSMGTTMSLLRWYPLLDVTYTGSYKNCKNFVIEGQGPEGCWDESQLIKDLNPPEMLVPGVLATKLFLTGAACDELLYNGIDEYAAKKGMLYMERFRRGDGSFEGHPVTNWLMFSIYSQLGLQEKAEEVVPFLKPGREEDTKRIILYLDCIWRAKRQNVLAEELLDRLEESQGADGNWRTVDGKKYYTHVTVEAIRVLRTWGRE